MEDGPDRADFSSRSSNTALVYCSVVLLGIQVSPRFWTSVLHTGRERWFSESSEMGAVGARSASVPAHDAQVLRYCCPGIAKIVRVFDQCPLNIEVSRLQVPSPPRVKPTLQHPCYSSQFSGRIGYWYPEALELEARIWVLFARLLELWFPLP